MDVRKDQVWLNGRLLPSADANVPAQDFGLLYGEGLFETMRARNGKVAHLDRHLRRLRESAAWLGLPLLEEAKLRRGLAELLSVSGGGDLRVRLTVTRGSAGPFDAPVSVPSTLLITARPAAVPPLSMKACWSPFRRDEENPLHRIKTTAYLVNVLARRHAKAHEVEEALFLNTRGELAEGATSNLFLLHGDRFLTPPKDAGVLPGVMRSVVLDRAHLLGLQPEEAELSPEDLFAADAAYLTNAVMGMVPLAAIKGRSISKSPAPHPMTERLQRLLWMPEDFQSP